MKDIDIFLMEKVSDRPIIVALHGTGAVGKTTIARQYLNTHENEPRFTSLWFMNADNETKFMADARVACRMVMPQVKNPSWTSFKDWLCQHPGWLIVLDNADDETSILDNADDETSILPKYMDGSNDLREGYILVTTRNSNIAEGDQVTHSIHIQSLSEEDGAEIIRDIAKTIDAADAKKISKVLGGLPLALCHTASYIRERRMPLDVFLRQWKEGTDAIDRHNSMSFAGGYERTITTIWDVKRMKDTMAGLVLNIFALLDPDKIPHYIITEGCEAPAVKLEVGPLLSGCSLSDAFYEAIGQLQRGSYLEDEDSSNSLYFNVHRMLQHELIYIMTGNNQSGQTFRLACRILSEVFPKQEHGGTLLTTNESESRCTDLTPHVLSLHRFSPRTLRIWSRWQNFYLLPRCV